MAVTMEMFKEIWKWHVARLCHAANREYCEILGDHSQVGLDWFKAPAWQRESAVLGVEFHLKELIAGGIPRPEASHVNWMAEKVAEGWKYGPQENPDKKEHPCIVPYGQLPPEQKFRDRLFIAIVTAAYWDWIERSGSSG